MEAGFDTRPPHIVAQPVAVLAAHDVEMEHMVAVHHLRQGERQAGKPPPALGLLFEAAHAGFGHAVVLGLAVRFGSLPSTLDPALLLQADERRIQRPLIQPERGFGDLLQACREAVGVLGSHRVQRPQDDEIQRSLQQLDTICRFTSHPSGLQARGYSPLHWLVK